MSILAVITVLIAAGLSYVGYRMIHVPDQGDLEAAVLKEARNALKGGQFQGLTVGVYKSGRSTIRGVGSINRDSVTTDSEDKMTGTAPDANTVFQIGSVSKVFTAMLLQKLVDDGAVAMDATLEQLLSATVELHPSVASVTLRDLATHTSGFPRVPDALLAKVTEIAGESNVMTDPYSHLTAEDIFNYLKTSRENPAGRFDYSNYGMGLLGHVLEAISGETYESLLTTHILSLIELSDTSITLTQGMEKRLAQGFTADKQPTPIWSFNALPAAGALSSTAQDMMLFIEACLSQTAAPLPDSRMPASPGLILISELFDKTRQPQNKGDTGLGWMQASLFDRFAGNGTMVWHNGMVGGYSSYLAIDKAKDIGVVVLSNRANSVDMLGAMLMRQARTQSWKQVSG